MFGRLNAADGSAAGELNAAGRLGKLAEARELRPGGVRE